MQKPEILRVTYQIWTLISVLLAFTGCVARQEPPVPHITQADRPRIADTTPSSPETSVDEAAQAYRDRLEALRKINAADQMKLDARGGWLNAPESLGPLEPGHFFRTAKMNGAWWFITPEGKPFVSKGVTDVNYLGATLQADEFHNIIVKKYGAEEIWAAAAEKRLLDWGFNTIGPWSSPSMTKKMSHAAIILDMGGHAPRHPGAVVTDYYDPAFLKHCVVMADQRAAPHAEDENLIGFFLDNEIVWGADHFRTNKSLLRLYVEFPSGAPGRNEALRFAREAAGSLDQFNVTWQSTITEWQQMETLPGEAFEPTTNEAIAVTEAFMLQVFHHYATVAITALRAAAPNHLVLGCRFHNYPGDALFEAAAAHFDVVSMAFYESRPPTIEIDAIFQKIDIPVLIEEWTFKSDDSGITNPLFGIYAPVVRTMQERCLAYDNYVETFMRRPYAVGYHWYKWMDNPVLPDRRMTGDNCGLLNQNDEPYQLFVEYISEVNRRVERWHAEGCIVK